MKDFTKGFILGAVSGVGAVVAASLYNIQSLKKEDIHIDRETIKLLGDNIANYAEEKIHAIERNIPRPGSVIEVKVLNNKSRKPRKHKRGFIK